MPNTLVHMGLQALVTRTLLPGASLCWIYLGCLLPDLPWIARRLVLAVAPGSLQEPAVGLYFLVQTSLLFCLLLSLALATLSVRAKKTFFFLASGSLLHLLLDACQDKWGNGVLLLAPWDWHLTGFHLVPLESLTTLFATFFGLVYVATTWRQAVTTPAGLLWRRRRLPLLLGALGAYLLLPLLLWTGPYAADSGYVRTMHERAERIGRFVEFDRAPYAFRDDEALLDFPSGEAIFLDGLTAPDAKRVSVRGTFVAADRIRVESYRIHPAAARDLASYAGLILIALVWSLPWLRTAIAARPRPGDLEPSSST